MNPIPTPSRGLPPRAVRAAARRLLVLAAAALAACGGDGTGSTPAPVAALVLTGEPDDVVLVGATVPLVATPVTADGVILNRPVAWRSSDSTLATVAPTGIVAVVGAGTVTITASAEGKEASVTLDARAGGELGPAGGTLRLLDGRITVTAQPGALPFPTLVLFRPALTPPPNARAVPGTLFEMEPNALPATPPLLLTLAYDPARLPAGVSESGLQLHHVVDGSWRAITGSLPDTVRNTVRGAAFAGGTYAVASGAPASVAIDGPLRDGAVYVGQARALQAVALDARGDTLRGRTIAWSTSDPARARVDGAGNVTGVGAGPVTITATVEGVQGSVTVPVLARPAASWGGAEWTTLQGNARHDGHVPATLDPTAFRERWVRPIGNFPRPAVTGGGRVYVTSGLLGPRQVTAFDVETGAVAWNRASAEGISGPAYADGRVYLRESGPNAAFLALDAADGAVRFSRTLADGASAGQGPVVAGGRVFVGGNGTDEGGVLAFDATTGERRWQTAVPWMDGQSPAAAGGLVFAFGTAGTGDGNGLTALNATDGSIAYTTASALAPGVRTPVLGGAGNVIGTVGGALASIRLPGGDVAWTVPGTYPSLPAVARGVVYAARDADVVAVRESDGTVLWTWTPRRGVPWGAPLVTDNLLFVSTQTVGPGGAALYVTEAIDVGSGKSVWSYPAGGGLSLGAGGTLFIAANGTLQPNGSYSDGALIAIAVR